MWQAARVGGDEPFFLRCLMHSLSCRRSKGKMGKEELISNGILVTFTLDVEDEEGEEKESVEENQYRDERKKEF